MTELVGNLSGALLRSWAGVLLRRFADFLRDAIRSREVILAMTRRDFASRYLGSYLGLIWAFINPLASTLVIWGVFQLGFKNGPVNGFPFILWLAAAMFPWQFFAEGLGRATSSVVDQSCVIKKVCFRASMLPIVAILSSLLIHLVFIVLLFGMFACYGIWPSAYALQIPYYLSAMVLMLLGISWLSSSLTVFLRDIPQVVGLLLQFGFWATPIFWQLEQMPAGIRRVLQLNPMYYIVQGYRDSLIEHTWFWDHLDTTLYFWGFTLVCFVLGGAVFTRLRPHFADVL